MEDKKLDLRTCLIYLKARFATDMRGLAPRIRFIYDVAGTRTLGDAIRLLYRIEKEKEDGKTNQGS